jgi:hypothetical protein
MWVRQLYYFFTFYFLFHFSLNTHFWRTLWLKVGLRGVQGSGSRGWFRETINDWIMTGKFVRNVNHKDSLLHSQSSVRLMWGSTFYLTFKDFDWVRWEMRSITVTGGQTAVNGTIKKKWKLIKYPLTVKNPNHQLYPPITDSVTYRFLEKIEMHVCTGVGLSQVVREVRQHPEDHRFESQRWQWINFPFWFAVDCER